MDRGGFILSRGVTHASEGEWKALPQLLEHLPLPPISLAADTACNAGRLRRVLEERGITAYTPSIQARIQHGRERGFRVPGRPSCLSPGQGAEAGRLSPPDRQLPVRGATEGLPGLSGEGRVPATQSETPVPGADHLLPAAPPGPGKESDSSLPAGDEPASGGCRGNIRIIRPTGVGEIAAKGVGKTLTSRNRGSTARDSWPPSPTTC